MVVVDSTNKLSFKGAYVLRVPKKAFKNPEDIKACLKQVDKTLAGGGKLYSYIEAFKAMFGRKSTSKVMVDKNGFLINAANKEGVHTFSVFSGADKDDILKQLSIKNIYKKMKLIIDSTNRKPESKEIMNDILRQIKWNLTQKKPKEIEVNSLEELKKYVGKL